MKQSLPERLQRADALRRRWRPDGINIGEWDLQTDRREFSQEDIVDMWGRFADGKAPEWATKRVSLYLHALLCPTKCSYCHCKARQPERKDERDEVFKRLMSDIARFGPVTRGLKFRDLYFGGGTPSIFHANQLERLFDALFSNFDIADDQERCIEMNPANARPEKIRLAQQAGFNRVSFGIESLTPSVLAAHNRGYQRDNKVGRAIEAALDANFENVNVDLLVLPGETAESFEEVVRKTVQWRPTEIHLYRHQRRAGYPGGEDTLSYRVARDLFAEHAVAAGYEGLGVYQDTDVCTRANLANDKPITQSYRHQSADHGSTLGLGPGADSVCRFFAQYKDRGVSGDVSPCYWGSQRGYDIEVRHYLLSQMVTRGSLELAGFQSLFGPQAWALVDPVLDDFEAAGWFIRSEDGTRGSWQLPEARDVITAGIALASEAELRHIESVITFTTPSKVVVNAGPVGISGWRVGGFHEVHTGWYQLEHDAHSSITFRVERDTGQRALAREGGLAIRYMGSELPPGGIEALRGILTSLAPSRPDAQGSSA